MELLDGESFSEKYASSIISKIKDNNLKLKLSIILIGNNPSS